MCHSTARLHLYSKVATCREKNSTFQSMCRVRNAARKSSLCSHSFMKSSAIIQTAAKRLQLIHYNGIQYFMVVRYINIYKYKHEPEEGKSEEKEDTWRPLGSLMDFYTGVANWQNRYFRLRSQGVIFFCRKRWYYNTGRQKPLYPYCRGAFWKAWKVEKLKQQRRRVAHSTPMRSR